MKSIAVFALLAAALQSVCIAQLNPPVTVTITTPTPVTKSGAEIRIDVTVVNTSDNTIKIVKAPGPDGHADAANQVEVYDAEGNKIPLAHRQMWISRKTVPVEPGKSYVDYLTLSKLFDLSKPGKYTVTVRHELMQLDEPRPEDRRMLIPSNPLTVTVTE
jgi:hypothetical protein